MKHRNEAFGRLLKAGIASIANGEGRTASVIEEQLGSAIGVSGDTVQRYKTGHLPPDDVAVKILAEAASSVAFWGASGSSASCTPPATRLPTSCSTRSAWRHWHDRDRHGSMRICLRRPIASS